MHIFCGGIQIWYGRPACRVSDQRGHKSVGGRGTGVRDEGVRVNDDGDKAWLGGEGQEGNRG